MDDLARKKRELEQRLADLQAKKVTANVPAPVASNSVDPTVDPEAEAIANELMKKFSRRATGEPTQEQSAKVAPTQSVETTTMSLSDREHAMLKSQKKSQARAEAAERKAENLEQSLASVTETLFGFTMRQQGIIFGELKWIDDWRRDNIRKAFEAEDKISIARKVFAAYPKVNDVALLRVVDGELIANWRAFHQGTYKQHDADYWLNWLLDVQTGKQRAIEGEPELVEALLSAEKVDVKQRLAEINAERLRKWEYEHPTFVHPTGQIRRTYE